jgi:hypothetical protein
MSLARPPEPFRIGAEEAGTDEGLARFADARNVAACELPRQRRIVDCAIELTLLL